jgi:hypothetical protein
LGQALDRAKGRTVCERLDEEAGHGSRTLGHRVGGGGMRGPWPCGLSVQLVAPQRLDTGRGHGPQLLLGEPALTLARASKAVRVLEFGLQGRPSRRGETLAARGLAALRTPGVVSTTLGRGPKPRGDAMPMPT